MTILGSIWHHLPSYRHRPDFRTSRIEWERAHTQLADARDLVPRVSEVVNMLRAERTRNNFAERIRDAYSAPPRGGHA